MSLKKFSAFLLESDDLLANIKTELATMSPNEVDDFGNYLYDAYLDGFEDEEIEAVELDNDPSDDETYEMFTVDEIMDILSSFPVEMLSDVYDDLSYSEDDFEEGEIVEMVHKKAHSNKNRRKFMGKDKSDLRRERTVRKLHNRMTKSERRLYYKKNRVNILAYHRDYYRKVKAGKHFKKLRKTT